MQKAKIFLTLAAIVAAGTAHAGAPQWKLSESAGTVNILRSGVSKIAISGGSLTAGDVITTGAKSRAVLVRGQEYVVVSPNSRLRISAPENSGGVVQFFEELGNVLFRIDKKATPHFGVKTPYLAAVVKGTTFSVTVTETGTAVQVTEGAVQVSTLDGGATQLLSPGMIGVVNQHQQFRLNIAGTETRTIDSPNAPAGSTETPEPMDDATLVEIANSDFEGTISAPILDTPVSLSELTGGLVSNSAATPAPTQLAALDRSINSASGKPGAVQDSNTNAVGRSNAVNLEVGQRVTGSEGSGDAVGAVNVGMDAGGLTGNVGNGNGNNGSGNGNDQSNGVVNVGVGVGGVTGNNGNGNAGNGNNGNGNGQSNGAVNVGVGVGGVTDNSGTGNANTGNGSNGNGNSQSNGVVNVGVDVGGLLGNSGNGNTGNGNGNSGNGGDDDDNDDGGQNGNAGDGNTGNGNTGTGNSNAGDDVSNNGNGNGNNGNGNGGGVNIINEIIDGQPKIKSPKL